MDGITGGMIGSIGIEWTETRGNRRGQNPWDKKD